MSVLIFALLDLFDIGPFQVFLFLKVLGVRRTETRADQLWNFTVDVALLIEKRVAVLLLIEMKSTQALLKILI